MNGWELKRLACYLNDTITFMWCTPFSETRLDRNVDLFVTQKAEQWRHFYGDSLEWPIELCCPNDNPINQTINETR
jgi:hypothetical protein